MSSKKAAGKEPAIKSVRLLNGTAFGRECIIHQSLIIHGRDTTRVDNQPIVIAFDADPRFLRVSYGEDRFTLVPFQNVGSITCEMVAAE